MSCFRISLLALVAAIANVDGGGFLAKTDQFSEVASDDSISNDEASAGYSDAEVAQDMPSGSDDTSPQKDGEEDGASVQDASTAPVASSSFVGLKPSLLQPETKDSDLTLLQTEQQDKVDPESDLALYGNAFTQMQNSEGPALNEIQEGEETESFVQLQNATAAVGEHLKTLVKEEGKFLTDLNKIETVDSESPAKTLEEASGYTEAEVQQDVPGSGESPVQEAIGFLEKAPTVPQEPSNALVQVQSESNSNTGDAALFNFWEAESKLQGKSATNAEKSQSNAQGSSEVQSDAVDPESDAALYAKQDEGKLEGQAEALIQVEKVDKIEEDRLEQARLLNDKKEAEEETAATNALNAKADDFDKYYKPNAEADADGAIPAASWIQEDTVNGTAVASKAFVQVQSDYEDPESDSALYGHPAEESLVQVPNATSVVAVKKEEENKVPNATAVMVVQAADKDAKVKEAESKGTQNVKNMSSASKSFVQTQSQQEDPESDMALYGSSLFLKADVDSQDEDGDAAAYQIDSPDVSEAPTLDL